MDTVTAARSLMGLSLAFHICFTAIGIGLPFLLFLAEGIALRTGNDTYREMARNWTRVAAVLFAIGAVSGTILSFEFGLLWSPFMEQWGEVFGFPFALEGFAFFTEAIFLGIYMFGWNKLSRRAHWLVTIPIMVSSAASALFVISANAWMNQPDGFDLVDGKITNVHLLDAMFNAAMPYEVFHGTMASYVATGFAFAGFYAHRPAARPRLRLQPARPAAHAGRRRHRDTAADRQRRLQRAFRRRRTSRRSSRRWRACTRPKPALH